MNKKMFSLMAILLSVLLLGGCVSKKEFDALEERVARLESNAGIVIESEANAAQETSTDGNAAANQGNSLYSLEEMTVEQKVGEIEYCLENRPRKGETFKEYADVFHAIPIYDESYASSMGSVEYQFDNSSKSSTDIIEKVNLSGVFSQMDSTIDYDYDKGYGYYNHVSVDVVAVLHDYNEATEIYNQLYSYLADCYAEVNNNTNGTYWSASGKLKNGLWNDTIEFVTLWKSEDFYNVTASMPYISD